MKNKLFITLPIIMIFSFILGSIFYILFQTNNHNAMADDPILFSSSYEEKILNDLNRPNTVIEIKDLASKIVLKNISDSNSINDLLQSRVKHGAEDLKLLGWVFFCLFVCITILAVGIYPILKKS